MYRKNILLLTTLMAAMMLSLAVAPALAKPNEVTVVVKRAGKPVFDTQVYIKQGTLQTGVDLTDPHGKAVFTLGPGDGWSADSPLTVFVYDNGYLEFDGYDLSSKLSARIVVTLP